MQSLEAAGLRYSSLGLRLGASAAVLDYPGVRPGASSRSDTHLVAAGIPGYSGTDDETYAVGGLMLMEISENKDHITDAVAVVPGTSGLPLNAFPRVSACGGAVAPVGSRPATRGGTMYTVALGCSGWYTVARSGTLVIL